MEYGFQSFFYNVSGFPESWSDAGRLQWSVHRVGWEADSRGGIRDTCAGVLINEEVCF